MAVISALPMKSFFLLSDPSPTLYWSYSIPLETDQKKLVILYVGGVKISVREGQAS